MNVLNASRSKHVSSTPFNVAARFNGPARFNSPARRAGGGLWTDSPTC